MAARLPRRPRTFRRSRGSGASGSTDNLQRIDELRAARGLDGRARGISISPMKLLSVQAQTFYRVRIASVTDYGRDEVIFPVPGSRLREQCRAMAQCGRLPLREAREFAFDLMNWRLHHAAHETAGS